MDVGADVSDNKTAAGPILSFVGGFLIFVDGAYAVYAAGAVASMSNAAGIPVSGALGSVAAAGWVGLVLGLIIMLAAVALAVDPRSHSGLGILIVLLSVVSLVGVAGGDGLGLLLGVLGGTCGVVFGGDSSSGGAASPSDYSNSAGDPAPASAGRAPSASPSRDAAGRTSRGCLNCGKVVAASLTVCPNCGEKM
jgi:hypothetical protein